jgi:hypothetical protein
MADSRRGCRMTRLMRAAVCLLREHENYDEGWGVVGCESTGLIDGQPWVHWRTAAALEDRGLVKVENWDEPVGGRLRLTSATTAGYGGTDGR